MITTAVVDAASLVEAAGHAVELWPDERPEPPDEQGHGPSPVAYGTWSPESGT